MTVNSNKKNKGVIVAVMSSSDGKTLVTCLLLSSLERRNILVQPFKIGPDYIDPSYLSAISGKDTKNLDVWLMGESELVHSFVKNSTSDISVIEGVIG